MKNIVIVILLFLWGSATMYAQETDDKLDAKRRLFIKEFIKTYEAAYEKQEREYIKFFFSSDALIITEKNQLLPHGAELVPKTTKRRPYETLIENRKQYLDRLFKLFDLKKKIRLEISGMSKIARHPKLREVYGVSFFQIWNDENDDNNIESQMPGYIFLIIDFRNGEHRPIIHVRTWQPKSNIKTDLDKYSLSDFKLYEKK